LIAVDRSGAAERSDAFGGIFIRSRSWVMVVGRAPKMKVISVNVGLPQEFAWKGMKVSTAIFKNPVANPVAINQMNLSGDEQADLTVHGGFQKAVYAYPLEHYSYWRSELPGLDLPHGNFGENLTTEGLSEEDVCIGDRIRFGTATLVVTQPRMPCYKLALRFGMDDMIKRFLKSRKSGFYFAVVEPGIVAPGSEISIVSRDPQRVSVADILKLYLDRGRNVELAQRVQLLDALPEGWKIDIWAKTQAEIPNESE
jgi:MOSC domain-containing protein YiiM